MSKAEGKPMLALPDEAVEALRRRRFLERVNAAYATLRADARAWDAVEDERHAWDVTLPDGLAVAEGRAPNEARSRPKRGGNSDPVRGGPVRVGRATRRALGAVDRRTMATVEDCLRILLRL